MNNRHRKTSRDSRESISDRDRSSDNDDASAAARLPPPEAKQKHPARSVVPARHLPPDATDEDLDAVLAAKNAIDANDWDADLLGLCRRLRSPMTYIVGLLLNQWQAADAIGVDESMITQLLEEVEAGYLPNNPYHNATHGADVAYTTHVMLVHGVREALGLADYQCAVCVLAAAAHDFRHPGIGANFLIATSDDLAIRYNDKSPLESMHTAEFFRLMKERPELNIFSKLERKEIVEVRKCIITMIMATDMGVHFDYLDRFQRLFSASPAEGEKLTLTEEERHFAMAMLLHCADISNPAKPREAYFDWTDRVLAEFYNQGDREQKAGLAVSTFYDRTKPGIAKMQTGFIQFIVSPIFTAWCTFVPTLQPLCMHHIEANAALWKGDSPPVQPEQIFVSPTKTDWDWKKGCWH